MASEVVSVDLSFDQIKVGDSVALVWTAAATEVDAFAALSGDRNPLHTDVACARARGFADRVAHGFLLGAKVSALVGMMMPGRRCLLLGYQLDHPNPVYVGETITIRGTVQESWPDLSLIELNIRATKEGKGKPVTVARGYVRCKIQS